MRRNFRVKIALALAVVLLPAVMFACSATPKPPSVAAHPATQEASETASSPAETPTVPAPDVSEASPTSTPVSETPTPVPPPPPPTPTPVAAPAIPLTARPNPTLTPGDVFADVGVAQICVKGYSTRVRDVSIEEKDQVYAEYGIFHHATGEYEVDHLVPLELGGSNDIKNLWPEPALPTPGFHQKDVLENTLHDLVCAGQVPLAAAQHAIASDWYAAYLQYVIR